MPVKVYVGLKNLRDKCKLGLILHNKHAISRAPTGIDSGRFFGSIIAVGSCPRAISDRMCVFSTIYPSTSLSSTESSSLGTKWAFCWWVWGTQPSWLHNVRTAALLRKEERLWVGAFILFSILLLSTHWKGNITFQFSLWFSSRTDTFRTFTKASPWQCGAPAGFHSSS